MADLLIHGGAVYGEKGWLDPGYVVIEEDQIREVSPGSPPRQLVEESETVLDADKKVLVPGLTNAHTHLSQTFMRGLAGGRSLLDWLKEVIWPLQREISPEELYLAALVGLVENLRCGASSLTSRHKMTASEAHNDAVCQAADRVGLRFTLARSWADLGSGAEQPEKILADLDRLQVQWQHHPRISIANGPLALWRCSAEMLQRSHQLITDYGGLTHFHVAETRDEVRMSVEAYDRRPVHWLEEIEVLDGSTELVHAVWVNEQEIEQLAEHQAVVVHCPVSNAVLGSGIAPIPEMLQAGIPVRLGTDGPASNDNQDLWETAKSALMIARISQQDATLLPPEQVLRLALAGKKLTAGTPADVVIVNLDHPGVVPVQDLSSALILGAQGGAVETVVVAGEILLLDGEVKVLDEADLLDQARGAITSLKKRAGLEA